MNDPAKPPGDAPTARGDPHRVLLDAGYTPAQIKLLEAAIVGNRGSVPTRAVWAQHLRALRPASFRRRSSPTFH